MALVALRRSRTPPRPRSLVASAAVMTRRPTSLQIGRMESWQDEAWDFYDDVGELRFAVGWLANGMSRVNLVAARSPQNLGDEPSALVPPDPDDPDAEPLTPAEAMAVELVRSIAGGVDAQGQLLSDAAKHLSVPGIGWILLSDHALEETPPGPPPPVEEDDRDIAPVPDETWHWQVLGYDSVRTQGDRYEVQINDTRWVPLTGDFVLIKVWRPHPRRSWEPDSPVRAVRTVLNRIRMLDEHVNATATSRLAGAGVFVVPSEAEFAPLPTTAVGTAPVGPPTATATVETSQDDDFTSTLVDTMTIPIGDRGSAAAVVPLTVRIPGEFCDKPRHITFWTEFSENVLPLQESGIRRLALGLDIPPEVLEGKGGMNHWGAWQIAEEAVTLHIEPMSETVVMALTLGYLRAALGAAGYEAEAADLMVWYDATDLTTRPDRSDDAIAAYDRIEVSGAALRREAGLSEDDAPDEDEVRLRTMRELAKSDPLVAAQLLRELGGEGGAVGTPEEPAPPALGPPEPPSGAPEEPEPPASTAAVVEACDALVFRALERAGGRLRSAAGKRLNGGAAAIECNDPARLHVDLGGATDFANLDALLDGAWSRVPLVAERLGLDPVAMAASLDTYTRALLATGHEHHPDRLADALGLTAAAC